MPDVRRKLFTFAAGGSAALFLTTLFYFNPFRSPHRLGSFHLFDKAVAVTATAEGLRFTIPEAFEASFLNSRHALGFTYSREPGGSLYLIPKWVLMAGFAVLPAVWYVSTLRRADRRASRMCRGLCLSCGYDLRATPGRCPECGADPPQPKEAA